MMIVIFFEEQPPLKFWPLCISSWFNAGCSSTYRFFVKSISSKREREKKKRERERGLLCTRVCVCVNVPVRVCVREREREWKGFQYFNVKVQTLVDILRRLSNWKHINLFFFILPLPFKKSQRKYFQPFPGNFLFVSGLEGICWASTSRGMFGRNFEGEATAELIWYLLFN